MKKIEFEQNEYTERYEDFLLSAGLKKYGQRLMGLDARIVTTKESGESVLVANPTVLLINDPDGHVMRLEALWSRNQATAADVDALEKFRAVDAIVRIGTYTDEKTGVITISKPKIVALLDRDGYQFVLTGGKREYQEQ